MSKKHGSYRVQRPPVTQPSDQSYKIIALTQGLFTKVDAADHPWLNQWNWFARWDSHTQSFYVVRGSGIYMHREILKLGPGEKVDHWNHDTLDNRRKNLRKATRSQNGSNRRKQSNNTSGFIGVTWRKERRKWQTQICYKRVRTTIGYFKSKKEAAHAYDEAAKRLCGEFAVINFPD